MSSSEPETCPPAYGWRYVFTNGDEHIYALDTTTGRLLWKQPTLGVDGMAALTVVNGDVYGESTVGDSGYLALKRIHSSQANGWSHTWAIDPNRGQYVWAAPYGVADASVSGNTDFIYSEGFDLVDAPDIPATQWATFSQHKSTTAHRRRGLKRTTGELVWR